MGHPLFEKELTDISAVCRRHHLPLFIDGARLAYALASTSNDVTLETLRASQTSSISAARNAARSSAKPS